MLGRCPSLMIVYGSHIEGLCAPSMIEYPQEHAKRSFDSALQPAVPLLCLFMLPFKYSKLNICINILTLTFV